VKNATIGAWQESNLRPCNSGATLCFWLIRFNKCKILQLEMFIYKTLLQLILSSEISDTVIFTSNYLDSLPVAEIRFYR
jgi:hypothetical protein